MKLKDITNAYLIRLMESSTELFQTKKYFSKDHVNSFLGLGIHRSGFYGKQVGNTVIPLKLTQTNFNEPTVTLHIEGVVSLMKEPTNTGTISYVGYGIIEVNGVPFFDGRGGNQTPPTSDDVGNDSTVPGTNVTQALEQLSSDTTILSLEVDDLKDNTFKVTYYENIDISSTTSGSLQSTPTGATINEDQFGDSGNSVLSTITVASTPTYESPLVGEIPVTVNLGINGSWVASNTYPDPVALIYSITIEFSNWDNVDNSKIIDYYQLEQSIGTDLSLGPISATNLDVNSSTGDNVTLPPADATFAGLMSAADKSKLNNIEPNATADQTASEIKGSYESNANTNEFTDSEKTKLSNQSNINTGDETTLSIQTKRAVKTVNGVSLEGIGDIVTPLFDADAEGVLTKYVSTQVDVPQTTNSITGVTYLNLVAPAVIGEKYLAIISFTSSYSALNSRSFVDVKDFGTSILTDRYELEPKDTNNRAWTTRMAEITPNPLGGGQFQLQLDFGSTTTASTTTMYSAILSLLKLPV